MANFNEAGLKKKLSDLNMSQQSIQTMSLWLIHHKKHAHVVVNIWYRELLKAPEGRKLAFMYLANDVIQIGKKKGPEYNKEFSHRLPKAFKHLASVKLEEKPINGLKRLLQVWEERGIFGPDLIKDFKKRLGVYSKEAQAEKKERKSHNHKKARRKSKEISPINEDEFPVAFQEPETTETVTKPGVESFSPVASPIPKEPDPEEIPAVPAVAPAVPVKVAPEPEELIQALQDLENAATADAEVRKKIASLPTSISDINGLNKLQDAAAGRSLVSQVDEALEMLEVYNKRLSQEMDARNSVARLLNDYISHQKDLLSQTEETLEEHRQKLSKVQKVRKELKAHLQNLPDISKLPSLGGMLAPLPSAGDLFT